STRCRRSRRSRSIRSRHFQTSIDRTTGGPSRDAVMRTREMPSLTVAASILALAGVVGAAQTPPPVREPVARGAAPAAQPSLRLLGVFDEDTGQPLAGVEVS